MKPCKRGWVHRLNPANLSLKMQIILSYLFICIFILGLSGTLTYNKILEEFREQREVFTITGFQEFEHNVDALFDEISRLGMVLITNDSVQQYLFDEREDEAKEVLVFNEAAQFVTNVLANYSYVNSVFFARSDEIVGFSSNRSWRENQAEVVSRFESTDAYQKVHESFPLMRWSGGQHVLDFSLLGYPTSDAGDEHAYITAMKEFRSMSRRNTSAMMVINVEAKHLSSLFKRIVQSEQERIQIMDENGTIISIGRGEGLGTKSSYFETIGRKNTFGSLVVKDGRENMQVVYYRLRRSNWMVVHEIPTHLYAANMVVLQNTLLVTFFLSLGLMALLYVIWAGKITQPLVKLKQAMRDFGDGNLDLVMKEKHQNEIGDLIRQFNRMSGDIRRLIADNKAVEAERHQMEVRVLQTQINPHFIYNTLNMIRWMAAMVKAGNIADVVVAFNRLLRPVFSSNAAMWTLEEEIEYVGLYLFLVNKRYGDGILHQVEINPDFMKCKVLRFMLQPLIENAVTHGFGKQGNLGHVVIAASVQKDMIQLDIRDDGVGMPPQTLASLMEDVNDAGGGPEKDGQGIGIRNIHRRLRLNYGKNAGLWLESETGKGTVVHLVFPWKE